MEKRILITEKGLNLSELDQVLDAPIPPTEKNQAPNSSTPEIPAETLLAIKQLQADIKIEITKEKPPSD